MKYLPNMSYSNVCSHFINEEVDLIIPESKRNEPTCSRLQGVVELVTVQVWN
jgi:hypothetical protein